MHSASLLALVAMFAGAAADERDSGAALDVTASVGTGLEIDTNANRVPDGELGAEDDDGKLSPPGAEVERPVADALARADGRLDLTWGAPGLVLRSESAAGVKLFFEEANERMAVAQSRASLVTTRLPGELTLALSAFGKGRAQRSGRRSYGIARGDAVLERAAFGVLWRAGFSGHAFQAFDDGRFSFAGGGALLGARVPLTDAERVDLALDLSGRGFPFAARDLDDPGETERRTDGSATLLAQITSARSVYLSAGYALVRNVSNARGESWQRHRLQALVGLRLPGALTVSAQGALQLTRYDDGVSIGQAYFLGDEEETQNVLELSVSRTLLPKIDLEARGALYGNELASEGARFSRQTASVGVRVRL